VAVHAKDGSVVRFFATATDINDRKRLEECERFLSHVSEVLASTLDGRRRYFRKLPSSLRAGVCGLVSGAVDLL